MADIKHWGLPCACKLACLSVCLSCVQLDSVWDGVWRLPRPSQGGLQRCFITAGMSAALVHNNKKDKRPFSMPCLLCGAFITWPLRERTALDKLGRENTGGQVHPNERERDVSFPWEGDKSVARQGTAVLCTTTTHNRTRRIVSLCMHALTVTEDTLCYYIIHGQSII